jgi:tRNA pseudouridine13 synthase
MKTLLKEYNIQFEMLQQINQRDFHCAGDYRKVICRPQQLEYEIITYNDELQPLIQTDYMKLMNINVLHQQHQNSNDETMAKSTGTSRDSNDSVVIRNDTVPHQQENTTAATTASTTLNNTTISNNTNLKNSIIGMTIQFTLPSSSYATICLRELMKRPTCSEYQRELQLR